MRNASRQSTSGRVASTEPIALSVRQPWAWLIVNGHKTIENRTWRTHKRGRILIHAGQRYDLAPDYWPWPDIERPIYFQHGGIIGQADIIDCVTEDPSRWFDGPFGFVLMNARPRRFRACPGRQGFFVPY